MKAFCAAFMCLQFGFVTFWLKDFGTKDAHKMLVKLTTEWQNGKNLPHHPEVESLIPAPALGEEKAKRKNTKVFKRPMRVIIAQLYSVRL